MIEKLATLLPLSYIAGAFIPLIAIDIKEHRLPNKIVLPLMGLTALCQLTLAIFQGTWAQFGLCLLLGFVAMVLGVILYYKGLIGMGDVKLLATLTMVLSTLSVLYATLFFPITIVFGFIWGMLKFVVCRTDHVPFGPVILATFAALTGLALI